MPTGSEFKVILDADGDPLDKGLKQAENSLKNFQKNANQAGFALTNLNRVVQDAPFGFIAIQNNLDPLLSSFQQLKVQTGSVGGALKALGSSLMGGAGIAVGLSLVTSLITTAIQKYGSLSAAISAVFSTVSDLQKMQKGLRDAMFEANKNAGEQIAKLDILVAVSKDSSRSMDERKIAAAGLVAQLKTYNIALSTEAALNGDVAVATLRARDAILERAKATAVADRLSKVESGILDIEVKRVDALENLNKANANLVKVEAALKGEDLTTAIFAYTNAVDVAKKALIELGDQQFKLGKERDFLLGQGAGIPPSIKPPPIAPLSTTFIDKSMENATEKLRGIMRGIEKEWDAEGKKMADSYFDAWAKEAAAKDKVQKIIDAFNGTNDAIKKGIVGIAPQGQTNQFGGMDLSNLEKRLELEGKIRALGQTPRDLSWLEDEGAKVLLLSDQWEQYSQKVTQVGAVVQQFLEPAFGQLFESIFSGTQSIGQAFTSFFKNLIKQMLVTIAKAAALAAIMSVFTGGSFGGLFKGFLGGGGAGGGGGPNLGSLLGGGGNGIGFEDVNFKISGNSLLGVLNRAGATNRRLGG